MPDETKPTTQNQNVVAALLSSKKFIALITGVVGLLLVKFAGFTEEAAADIADKLANLVMAYLGAQGVADLGRGIGSNRSS